MVTLCAGVFPRDAVRQVQAALEAAGCPDADFDARELFRLATAQDARLSDRALSADEASRLTALTARRAAREPLQYLCGTWPFLDFELAVGPGVLCPRADTEVVAEAAAAAIAGVTSPRVLDLCAGTGCLGIGVRRLCPAAHVTCVEKSADAFAYLEKNARIFPAVEAVQGDVFAYWKDLSDASFDLIVSNPPYLTAAEMADLQPEVAWEPAMALAAGEDGLDFYRVLAAHYKNVLCPGGVLALEIGWQQRQTVTALLKENGWHDITCKQDFGGNDRCVLAKA